MSNREKIQEILSRLPEETLEELLKYLEVIEKSTQENLNLGKQLTEILKEDTFVLQELAK